MLVLTGAFKWISSVDTRLLLLEKQVAFPKPSLLLWRREARRQNIQLRIGHLMYVSEPIDLLVSSQSTFAPDLINWGYNQGNLLQIYRFFLYNIVLLSSLLRRDE